MCMRLLGGVMNMQQYYGWSEQQIIDDGWFSSLHPILCKIVINQAV